MLMLKTTEPAQAATGTRRSARDFAHTKQFSRVLDSLVQRVSDYTVQLLRGEAPDRPDGQSLGPKPITSATYTSLLPTVWALISSPGADFAENVAQACVEHGTKASSLSAVKRHAIDFIGRLLLVSTSRKSHRSELTACQLDAASEYRGFFRPARYHVLAQKLRDWLLHLPKTLWELGASNLPATEVRIHQATSDADSDTFALLRQSCESSFVCNSGERRSRPPRFVYSSASHISS